MRFAVSAIGMQERTRRMNMIQFKKILCPVDFFKASSRAFEYALRLGANYGARVHVLHMVAPMIPSVYGAQLGLEDLTARLEKESKQLLQKYKDRGAKANVGVTTEVRLGDIDLGILHSIEDRKADLVVMGTHGRRGFERLILGSVTERMIRHCPVPLLVIGETKKTTPPKIRRILVTTDFSEGTAEAVVHALSVGQRNRAKVTVLHVLHDDAVQAAGKYRDQLVRGIEMQLQKFVPERAFEWSDIETRIEDGSPPEVIPK